MSEQQQSLIFCTQFNTGRHSPVVVYFANIV